MKKLLVVPFLLVGCATDPKVMQMAIDANQKVKPTIELTCPNGGCTLAYTDPRDRQAVKLPTNGWDAFNNTVSTAGNVLSGAIVPVAMGVVAVKGFDSMKGHGTVTNTTTVIDDHSATATPTVVTQPVPTVVNQPAPVVVQVPAGQVVNPVVVTQPAPVIVNPVVVGP